jgi:hypothetical protein
VRSDFQQKNVVQFTTAEGLAHEIKCLHEVISDIETKANEERVLMETKLDKLHLQAEQSLLMQIEIMNTLRSNNISLPAATTESIAVRSVGPVCTLLDDHRFLCNNIPIKTTCKGIRELY